MDARWMTVLAGKMNSADFAITACIIAMIFFMRFNRHEGQNKANLIIGVALAVGFLALVYYRIFGA